MFFPEQTSGQLPARLERSESRMVSIKMQDLVEVLLKNSTKGKIKIRICFKDSFGRKYLGKWLIDTNQFL